MQIEEAIDSRKEEDMQWQKILTGLVLAGLCAALLLRMALTLKEQVSMVAALDQCRMCEACEVAPNPPVSALDDEPGETLQIDDDVAILSFFRDGRRRYVDLTCVIERGCDGGGSAQPREPEGPLATDPRQ
jgi:hypothetical protein